MHPIIDLIIMKPIHQKMSPKSIWYSRPNNPRGNTDGSDSKDIDSYGWF
jgi:hypothetical protein